MDGVFTGYVGRMFAVRFAGLLFFFVIILQMLDLLNKSSDIYAAAGADWRSVVKYISLRAPEIASQFTPFAALLSIVISLSTLNHRSEITIMRAAGMSVHRVLLPIGFVCLLISCAHFLLHEMIVVRSTEKLAFWEANSFAVDLPEEAGTRTDVRLTVDGEFISASSALRNSDGVMLSDVVVYTLDEEGLATHVIEAPRAIYNNAGWRFENPRTMDAATLKADAASAQEWRTNLDPDILFAISLNPDRTALGDLLKQIGQLRRSGADVRSETTSLLGRFSKPMATLLMPLLGAIAGFGVTRQGAQLARSVAGAALGFGYFVLENMMLALGKLGAAPAALGAFFPFALFLVVGFTILLMMEN